MSKQQALDLISEFQYYDWEYYFCYKFKNNSYLCGMNMDQEHSYRNQDIIKIYDSLPEDMDEFILNHKRKEDYFFLGFSYDFCEAIQLKHQVYPLLEEQNYDAMYDLIKSHKGHHFTLRNIQSAMIDYFFHYHIREGEITQDDDYFFLDLHDLFEQKHTRIAQQFLENHALDKFKFRTIEEVKELAVKTKEYLSFTHRFAYDMNEVGSEMQHRHGTAWYKLICYEQMLSEIHHEKNHIEQMLKVSDEVRPKKKII
jgi:hypothetical protein